jgi:8-oxo-dGTP diphosphatase
MSDSLFPTVQWGEATVIFEPGASCEAEAVRAVVVFAILRGSFVIADIPDRGWCTPSGRLEAGETPLQAAVRETWEEIGARLERPRAIGRFLLNSSESGASCVPAFVGEISDFGAIPEGSESRGVRQVSLEELADCYWVWDPLMEAVFRFALETASPA